MPSSGSHHGPRSYEVSLIPDHHTLFYMFNQLIFVFTSLYVGPVQMRLDTPF